jgi:hypothetical protein
MSAPYRLVSIPMPADAEDTDRAFAVVAEGGYLGRVVSCGQPQRWEAYGPTGRPVGYRFGTREAAAEALVLPPSAP